MSNISTVRSSADRPVRVVRDQNRAVTRQSAPSVKSRGNAMNPIVYASDPWAGVLEHLEEATSLNRETSAWATSRLAQLLYETAGPDYYWPASGGQTAPLERTDCQTWPGFTVVERCDERDIVISWQDSTRGRLGDQRWRLGTASGSGVCAMSGGQIRRGDCIYRPLRRASKFASPGDMILATAIDSVHEDTPASP